MPPIVRVCVVIAALLTSAFVGRQLHLAQRASMAAVPAPVLAQAAPTAAATTTPSSERVGIRLLFAPLLAATATATPLVAPAPSIVAEPSPTVPLTPSPFPQLSVASFRVHDSGMRHNIELALRVNDGALRRVVLAPGAVFSFNASLGPDPNRLPWRSVGRRLPVPTPAVTSHEPAEPPGTRLSAMRATTPTLNLPAVPFVQVTAAPADQPPTQPPADAPAAPSEPTAETTVVEKVLGGGICDLASRFVVAGRKLLPPSAFRFKRHTGGVAGVAMRDAVSIWATGGGRGDNDLLITNTTEQWLVFEVYSDAERVTVVAWLQGGG